MDDPPGYRNYWTAENVVDLPDEAIDAVARRAAELPAGPSQLFIVAWGGALARFGPEHSPLAGRDAGFIVHPLLLWEDPADDERNRALARAFRTDCVPGRPARPTRTSSATKAASGCAPPTAPAPSGWPP